MAISISHNAYRVVGEGGVPVATDSMSGLHEHGLDRVGVGKDSESDRKIDRDARFRLVVAIGALRVDAEEVLLVRKVFAANEIDKKGRSAGLQ